MITVLQEGRYSLIETRNHVKILTLGIHDYAWVYAQGIGEILVASHNPHTAEHVLARGSYRLYEVADEPGLSDHEHLELSVGLGSWQGYLLLGGLPQDTHPRTRIVATNQTISGPNWVDLPRPLAHHSARADSL